MSENVQELIAEAQRFRKMALYYGDEPIIARLIAALEAAESVRENLQTTVNVDLAYMRKIEAERDAALAVIAEVRAALTSLDSQVSDEACLSHGLSAAFDAIVNINAAIAKATP